MNAETQQDKRSAGRGVLKFLLVVIVLVVLVLAFLPTILSMNALRPLVLSRVNNAVDGTVNLESLSLNWFGKIRLTGVEFTDEKEEALLQVKSVTVPRGLVHLVPAGRDLGTVEIDEPNLIVVLPQPEPPAEPAPPKEKEEKPPAPEKPEKKKPSPPPRKAEPIQQKVKGKIVVKNGRIEIRTDAQTIPLVIDRVNTEMDIKDLEKPIQFKFEAMDKIKTEGLVTVMKEGLIDPRFVTGNLSLTIDDLDLAPFAAVAGSFADAPDVKGRLTANLSAEIKDIAVFDAKGGIRLESLFLSGGPFKEDTPQLETVALDFDVSQKGEALTVRKCVVDTPLVKMSAVGALDEGGPSLESLELTSSFAQASGKGNMDEAEIDLAIDLKAALAEAARYVDTKDLELDGRLRAEVRMQPVSDLSRAFTVISEMRDLKVSGVAPRPLKQELVKVELAGQVNLSPTHELKNLTSFSGSLASAVVTAEATLERFTPGPEGSLPKAAGVKIKADADLDELIAFLNGLGLIPPESPLSKDTSLSGKLHVDLQLPETGGPVQEAGLEAVLEDIEIVSGSETVLSEPRGTLSATAKIDAEQILLEDMNVRTELLDLSCSGSLRDLEKQQDLELRGEWECDLARVAALVTVLTGREIDVEGKRAQEFSLTTSLGGKTWVDKFAATDAEAGLYVKRSAAFGVETGELEPRLVIKDSRAVLTAATTVNEGQLALEAVVDATGEEPVLLVADDSQVLEDVKLTDEMASELLALAHPALKGCTIVAGSMGLLIESCRVPLNERFKEEMVVTGNAGVNDVVLQPGGILGQVFEVAKMKESTATVPNQEIAFTCKEGRIESTPLSIISGPHTVVFSGSVGTDGTLDYLAEMPVTEELVGKQAYPYVKETTLKLPIKGTVSRPKISRESFEALVKSLGKDALKNVLRDEDVQQQLKEEGMKLLDKYLK